MSKMKELDLIAQGVADHMKEIIEDSVDWQMSEVPLSGDDYNQAKEYVINVALNKLQNYQSKLIAFRYKNNTNTLR